MEDSKGQGSGSFGGKTVGSLGGGITLYLAGLVPDGDPLKPLFFYASPIVAVFAKEWGGMLLYEAKLLAVGWVQNFKLERVKKRIDGIPDHPDYEGLKKDVNKEYIEAVGEVIRNNIKSVREWSRLAEDKNVKIKSPSMEKATGDKG
ncbi:hypothetical protein ACP3VQ_24895 [Metapseudomonas otitidis]|uniref:hypothetical protein n=1 Tax=Metapseudomonas otitidis TaxID=319939 RepID=UPI003CEC40AB